MNVIDDPGALGRFLTVADTAEILNISVYQAYALLRSGQLAAIKVGTSKQWRIERTVLEEYIEAKYEETRRIGLWNQAEYTALPEYSFGTGRAKPSAPASPPCPEGSPERT